MKDMGGYFGLEQLVSNEYHSNLIPLNSGRSGLLYLLKAKKIKKIYFPHFICDSVTDICKKNGCEFEYYHISYDFLPLFNKSLKDDEFLYIVNFYGQLDEKLIIKYKEKHQNIIIDNTQDFFQRPVAGVDTIYSCRKFFGVPDGGYLSTEVYLTEELKEGLSTCRMKHVLGRYENSASEFYNDFKNSEELLAEEPLELMSRLTSNLLGAVDYQKVREIRSDNFNFLADKLGSRNKLILIRPQSGPFAYPLYLENGNEIKRKLARKKIYIPTLWPEVLKRMPENSIEFDYAANILPLPCDQRYSIEDMENMLEEINNVQA